MLRQIIYYCNILFAFSFFFFLFINLNFIMIMFMLIKILKVCTIFSSLILSYDLSRS